MKRAMFLILASMLTVGMRAAESLTLPFSVCGHSTFQVGDAVDIQFLGTMMQVRELTGLTQKGHVYYVPADEALLLQDADLVSGGFVVQRRSAGPLTVYVKGQNTVKAQRTALQSSGAVTVKGEGVASQLDVKRGCPSLLMAGGDVRLTGLTLSATCTGTAIIATTQGGGRPLLAVDGAVVSLESQSGQVVTGFDNVVTTGCGLPMSTYAAQKLLFDKGQHVFQLLKRTGLDDARQLSLSCAEAYITIDTRKATDTWSMDDGQLVEAIDGVVELPFEVRGVTRYTVGKTVNTVVDGDDIVFYELQGAADRGTVYYQPETHVLLLDGATVNHERTNFIVYSRREPVRVLVWGENTLRSVGHVVYSGIDITFEGKGSGLSVLNIGTIEVMGGQPNYALHAYSNMTLSDLTVSSRGFETLFFANMPSGSEPETALTLRRVAGNVVAMRQVAYGFSHMHLEGCTAREAVRYENHQLKSGTQACKELHLTAAGAAQSASATATKGGGDSQVFEVVEQQPYYGKGAADINQFLAANISYPAICQENNIQGNVYVQFTVETDGTLSDITTLRAPDPSLGKEAERVVRLTSGGWTPGRQSGKAVRTRFMLPVHFRLVDASK